MKKLTAALLILILALTAVMCGCNGNSPAETTTKPEIESINESDNGYEKSFVFEVIDIDGNKTQTTIETNGEYVGIVLQELGYIEGEQGDYGLYIKKVNGITADYNIDGTYWAFYVNDAYAMASADLTPIVDGDVYSFRVEKM